VTSAIKWISKRPKYQGLTRRLITNLAGGVPTESRATPIRSKTITRSSRNAYDSLVARSCRLERSDMNTTETERPRAATHGS
jgi:hypothetical protein